MPPCCAAARAWPSAASTSATPTASWPSRRPPPTRFSSSMTLDYRTAFEMAPIGLVLSAQRLIKDCNRQLLAMFGAEREQLIGQSFEVLYPSHAEFERTGERIVAALDTQGYY